MESYLQLVFIMTCYTLSEAELVVAYNHAVEQNSRSQVEGILKLFQLRNCREAFDAGMVRRFYT